jgi:hypothetical protein
VHITTTPSAAVAGDTVRATFTIENVTSGTLTRTIGYLYYPRAFVADGSDGLRDLLIFGSGAPSTAITLGPHESVSGVSTFLAYRAGVGELTGCLPLDAITLDVPVCADATVAIKEH